MAASGGQRHRWFQGGTLRVAAAALLTFLLLQYTQAEGCGKIVTDASGAFNHSADQGLDCTWTFETDGIHSTELSFYLNSSSLDYWSCRDNFIQIMDGEDILYGYGRYCSFGGPVTVENKYHKLSVRFFANSSEEHFAMSVSWTTVCNKTFRDSAVLYSPGYPDSYMASQQCHFYFIRRSSQYSYRMEFTYLHLPTNSSQSTSCDTDYVQVNQVQSYGYPYYYYSDYYYDTSSELFCRSDQLTVVDDVESVMFVSGPTQQMADYGFHATLNKTLACSPQNLTSESGTIQAYVHNDDHVAGICSWAITVEEGSSVLLLIENLYLLESQTCDSENLKIYEGHSPSDSNLLATYCGVTRGKRIESTSNKMLVEFFTKGNSNYISGTGWYSSTKDLQECQDLHLTSPQGELGWSDEHLMLSKRCLWNLTAESGSLFQIAIQKSYVNSQFDYVQDYCEIDFIKIYEGSEVDENHLIHEITFCSQQEIITSTTNKVLVVLENPADYARVHFSATYTAVNASAFNWDCGGNLTGNEGEVTSPNYPEDYNILTECVWHLSVDPIYIILFDIIYSIPSGSSYGYTSCGASDALKIWTGGLTSSYTYAHCLSGSGHSKWIRTDSGRPDDNQAVLKFQSDSAVTGSGFRARWHSVCEKTFYHANASTLQSPNYPGNYPSNVSCVFTFEVVGYSLEIDFQEFNLEEANSDGTCTADYLEVIYPSDDQMSLTGIKAERFCGSTKPNSLTLYPPLVINFVTNLNISKTGYKLAYDFIKGECGQEIFTEQKGIIKTPNHPGTFPPSINCSYTIEVEQGQTVYLTFNNFSMGETWMGDWEGSDCLRWNSGSLLIIADGVHTSKESILKDNSSLLGIYCGLRTPTPLTSFSNSMTVIFMSFYNWRSRGFTATYTALGNTSEIFNNCGGELKNTSGTIDSPVSPTSPALYPDNAVCEWVLTVPENDRIRITFDYLDLQDSTDCQLDFLEFRDGRTETDTRLDRRCGNDLSKLDVTSTGNMMHVKFISDLQNSSTGFRFSWTAFCEETFRGSSGTIQPPTSSSLCTFIIEQWQGYVVHLSFSHFQLGDNCLEVRDGGYEGAPLLGSQRYCGNSLPPTLISSQSMMWIRYFNEGSKPDIGFTATYKRERITCGKVFLKAGEEEGKFTSPRYPESYPNHMDCEWEISTEENNRIQLSFDSFSLEASNPCQDWVKIYDGTTWSKAYCGNLAPETFTSSGSMLRVTFNSNWRYSFRGFSATYVATSDELTKQKELYPHGKGDSQLDKKHDSILRIEFDSKFPFGSKLHKRLCAANKGMVTFTKKDKGRKYTIRPNKPSIYVANTNMDAPGTDGGVYIKQYTDNEEVLERASNDVRSFTQHKTYSASHVVVITWVNMPHRSNNKADRAIRISTFQLVLISDGTRSFALMIYKDMNWSVQEGIPLVIAFSDGQQTVPFQFLYSGKPKALNGLQNIIGNTGRKGMWIKQVGYAYSAEQHCNDWYRRNRPFNKERQEASKGLPKCPCNWWVLWGNWRWSHWRDDYKVMCFRLTVGRSRQLAPYGKECCYTADWQSRLTYGQFIQDGPHAGSATAYNPAFWSMHYKYLQEDRLAHDVCCYKTKDQKFCQKYYSLRAVGECSTRIPFTFSWTWGDPHIKTLDKLNYTFNGLGEYTLIQSTITGEKDKWDFDLHGQTKLAETETGLHINNATVFRAFAAKQKDIRVFIGLNPETSDSFVIYANESSYTKQFYKAGKDEILEDTDDYLLKRNNDSAVVSFASGVILSVSISFKALEISITMPSDFSKVTTRGLMGNYNGKSADDFVLPDGTVLSADLTERQIYYNFGQKWAVTEDNSLMRDIPGMESVSNAASPSSFVPVFLDETNQESKTAAEDVCGGKNKACIFDYLATGSNVIAKHSKDTSVKADKMDKIIDNTIPTLDPVDPVRGKSGQHVTFKLKGHDPDVNDSLTYSVETDGQVDVQVNEHTGDVTLLIDHTKPSRLRGIAMDSSGAKSVIVIPQIHCWCNNRGDCDNSTTNSSVSDVFFAGCVCLPHWTGDHCEEETNGCDDNPCHAQQNCTDLKPDDELASGSTGQQYICSECAQGYVTDPDAFDECFDIDECTEANNCSQTCINLPGSFRCDCQKGYRLLNDKITCVDINECADNTDGCDHQCINKLGGFDCQCFPGYALSEQGVCELDGSSPAACKNLGCQHACTVSDSDHTPSCFCLKGYRLDVDGKSCVDRDECTEGLCSQACFNTNGSFACSCHAGFFMASDQRTCQPCEELHYGQDCQQSCRCIHGNECHPVKGCVCEDGWTGDQCQHDVNECDAIPSVCKEGQKCVNTDGSFYCKCLEGYALDSGGSCQDVDECDENLGLSTCNTNVEICHNTPGSHYCSCKPGFSRVGGTCSDIDECATMQHGCQHKCKNTFGSYTCSCYPNFTLELQDEKSCRQKDDVCQKFEGIGCEEGHCSENPVDNTAYCFCDAGFKLATDNKTCLDVDECRLGIAGCSGNSVCVNTNGGFKCECPVGSALENDGKTCLPCPHGKYGKNCSDLCACGLGSNHCDKKTGCVCKNGWTGEKCDIEINACETLTAQQECLEQNAHCVSALGKHKCECAPGYRFNASNICADVNECLDKKSCEQHCENTLGSYHCLCSKGFSMDPQTGSCVDIDECSLSVTNKCTQSCENTLGSYYCVCDIPGYILDNDGFTCSSDANCVRTDCPTENGGCGNETCFCNSGYALVNDACQWIDEDLCAKQVCEQTCDETPDGKSFVCGCENGYTLNSDSRTCSQCAEGQFGPGCSSSCQCNGSPCSHVDGTCTCLPGWTSTTCDSDIDECTSLTCPKGSECINLPGSHLCQCKTGYVKNATGDCDVCASTMYGSNCEHTCDCTIHATSCDHVTGACTCQQGWTGAKCEVNINECDDQGMCSSNQVCFDHDGGYSCGCVKGYTLNESGNCTDVDECFDDDLNDCSQNCINTAGSYECNCFIGWVGTGNNCKELPKFDILLRILEIVYELLGIENHFSNNYKAVVQEIKRELKDRLCGNKRCKDVSIRKLSAGSLVISASVIMEDPDEDTVAQLTLALVALSKGQLTIGNQTGNVTVDVGGYTVSSDPNLCTIFTSIKTCPAGTQCDAVSGSPSCRNIPDESVEIWPIAVGASAGVLVIAGIVILAVLCLKKKRPKTAPLMAPGGMYSSPPAATLYGSDPRKSVGSVSVTFPSPVPPDDSQLFSKRE